LSLSSGRSSDWKLSLKDLAISALQTRRPRACLPGCEALSHVGAVG
jgi:hypothetical protein